MTDFWGAAANTVVPLFTYLVAWSFFKYIESLWVLMRTHQKTNARYHRQQMDNPDAPVSMFTTISTIAGHDVSLDVYSHASRTAVRVTREDVRVAWKYGVKGLKLEDAKGANPDAVALCQACFFDLHTLLGDLCDQVCDMSQNPWTHTMWSRHLVVLYSIFFGVDTTGLHVNPSDFRRLTQAKRTLRTFSAIYEDFGCCYRPDLGRTSYVVDIFHALRPYLNMNKEELARMEKLVEAFLRDCKENGITYITPKALEPMPLSRFVLCYLGMMSLLNVAFVVLFCSFVCHGFQSL